MSAYRTSTSHESIHQELRKLRHDLEKSNDAALNLNREVISLKSKLERTEREAEELRVSFRKLKEDNQRISAINSFVDADTSDLTKLLDSLKSFHAEVESIHSSIFDAIFYQLSDLFQEELNRCYEETRRIIGGDICDLLVACSADANANAGQSGFRTPRKAYLRAVLQLFIVHFCASMLDPQSVYTPMDHTSGRRQKSALKHRIKLEAGTLPTRPKFKTIFLRKFSNLLKAAGWTIQGPDRRAAFEDRIPGLFDKLDNLRTALEGSVKSKGLTVYLVLGGLDSSPSSNGDPQIIIGTVELGLAIEHESMRGELQVKDVLPARIIWESSLRATAVPARASQSSASREHQREYQDGRDTGVQGW